MISSEEGKTRACIFRAVQERSSSVEVEGCQKGTPRIPIWIKNCLE